MTIPSSGFSPLPASAGQPTPGRGQGAFIASAILGGIALAASAPWTLVMVFVARAVRPPELSQFPAYRGDVTPFQQAALARITVIAVVSFVAILALAALAIFLGRRAQRRMANDAALVRVEGWAVVSLIVSLVGLGAIVLLGFGSSLAAQSGWVRFHLPPQVFEVLDAILSRAPFILMVLAAVTAASALASFMLSGVAVRKTHGHAQAVSRLRRWRAHISLVVSALILLVWFAFTALAARFIVAFYLHLVY